MGLGIPGCSAHTFLSRCSAFFLSRAAALFCFVYLVSVPVTLPVFAGTVSVSENFLVIFNKIVRHSAQNRNFSLDDPPPELY